MKQDPPSNKTPIASKKTDTASEKNRGQKTHAVLAFGITVMGFSISLLALEWKQHLNTLALKTTEFSSLLGGDEPNKRAQDLGEVTTGTTPKNETSVIINDPGLKEAWAIQNISAEKAWQVTRGNEAIVVAVIDTGCDFKHEDLQGNQWKNPGEIPGNGKDDDGNGFRDDDGWNFVSNNADLSDNHGHGTHISGIIAANAGNGKGIAGIAPNIKIMCLKYYDPKVAKSDNLKNTIAAIRYAVKMKANIINYSGGGTEFSLEEKQAIEEARDAGILFVAAAGNERSNSDKFKYYPADYGLTNIVSVTAIDQKNKVLPSSNYGIETVDLAAPGYDIISTLPNNNYGKLTGTSQATAFVTGAAALIMSNNPKFNFLDTKKYLLQTGDQKTNLAEKTRTSRQLNLFKALTVLDSDLTLGGAIAGNSPKSRFTASSTLELAQDTVLQQQLDRLGLQLMKSLDKKDLSNKN